MLSELVSIFKGSSISISNEQRKTEVSISEGSSISIQEKAKPIEYRSHLCKDCKLDAKAVEDCRIRWYRYTIYGFKCPKEITLEA